MQLFKPDDPFLSSRPHLQRGPGSVSISAACSLRKKKARPTLVDLACFTDLVYPMMVG